MQTCTCARAHIHMRARTSKPFIMLRTLSRPSSRVIGNECKNTAPSDSSPARRNLRKTTTTEIDSGKQLILLGIC